MRFAAPLAYLNISIFQERDTEPPDAIGGQASPVWARKSTKMVTLHSRVKNGKHLPSLSLPDQPDSCPDGAVKTSCQQDLKTLKSVESAGIKMMVWSLALRVRSWATAQEMWPGLGQLKTTRHMALTEEC